MYGGLYFCNLLTIISITHGINARITNTYNPITKTMKKLFTVFNLFITVAVLGGLTSCRKYPSYATTSVTRNIPTEWTKIAALPADEKFTVLETSANTVYAASASGKVYSSSDTGSTWSASAIVKQGTVITALAIFGNNIYVGTGVDGVFVSGNGGQSWTKQADVDEISSFTIWNNNLYLSAFDPVSPSGGVMVLNQSAGTWSAFNGNGLPSNYDYSVAKIIGVNQKIVSIRGVNGFFYSYDGNAGQWNQADYAAPHRIMTMQDLVYDQNTLLASSGKLLFNSANAGATWAVDTVGLPAEPVTVSFLPKTRVLYSINGQCYVVSNVTGGAYIQQRNISSPVGTSWATHNDVLQFSGLAYSMCALNNVLYLATDGGLYYKKV